MMRDYHYFDNIFIFHQFQQNNIQKYYRFIRKPKIFHRKPMKTPLLSPLTWIFMCLLFHKNLSTLIPTFQIVQYEPLTFELAFNTAVRIPQFQLMKNGMHNLRLTLLSSTDVSQPQRLFYFTSENGGDSSGLESYQLYFNSPLNVGDGSLSIEYFIMQAKKPNIEVPAAPNIGAALILIAYLTSFFTIQGYLMVEFIQVFALLLSKITLKTDIYKELFYYMPLLSPVQFNQNIYNDFQDVNHQNIILQLALPLLAILIGLFVGVGIKKIFKNKAKSPKLQIIYNFFSFNIFLTFASNLVFCCFFNGLQYICYTSTSMINPQQNFNVIAYILAYLNLGTALWICYLIYYKLNPKINQTEESWKSEIGSPAFIGFNKFHEEILMDSWISRNTHVFSLLKRLSLVICYLFLDGFQFIVMFLEFAQLYYILTVRPYKQEYYRNCFVIFRLLFFIFCVNVAIGQLYFQQGDGILLNYSIVKTYLLVRGNYFLSINCLIMCSICYEVYHQINHSDLVRRWLKPEKQEKAASKKINSIEMQTNIQNVMELPSKKINKAKSSSLESKISKRIKKSKSKKKQVNKQNNLEQKILQEIPMLRVKLFDESEQKCSS